MVRLKEAVIERKGRGEELGVKDQEECRHGV